MPRKTRPIPVKSTEHGSRGVARPALPMLSGTDSRLPTAEIAAAADYAAAEKALSTRRAYRADFAAFRDWCAERGTDALPAAAATVAGFVASEAGRCKPATISRRAAAIGYAHRLAGHVSPTADERVRSVMRGIRRTLGAAEAESAGDRRQASGDRAGRRRIAQEPARPRVVAPGLRRRVPPLRVGRFERVRY
jgi:hypothetical protein